MTDNFRNASMPQFVDVDPQPRIMRVALAMWTLLIAAMVIGCLAWTIEANAAEVFATEDRTDQAMSLTLLETKCSNEVIRVLLAARIKPELVAAFKDSRLLWQGKEYASCWLDHEGVVYSIDELGEPLQPIPREYFKDKSI